MSGVTLYVIYDHPRDFPDKFVLRRWVVVGGTTLVDRTCSLADDLASLRQLVPPGMVNIHRCPQDDPAIAEVWL